jgi:rubrerythrin
MSAILEGLRSQRVIEMRNVAGLRPLAETAPSVAVSAVLEIIIHDSRKHMALCDALIKIESGESPDIPESSRVSELRETLLRHIELERNMLRQLEALRPLTDGLNEGLIEYMLADERRHHGLLMGLIELLDQSEEGVERYDALVDRLLREAHQPGNVTR